MYALRAIFLYMCIRHHLFVLHYCAFRLDIHLCIFTYVYSHNNIFHLCTTFVCQLLQRQQEGQREDHSRDVCLHFYTNILGADRAIYSHNIIYSMIFISKYISKYMFTRFARSILITYVLFYGILEADTCLRASRDIFSYIRMFCM